MNIKRELLGKFSVYSHRPVIDVCFDIAEFENYSEFHLILTENSKEYNPEVCLTIPKEDIDKMACNDDLVNKYIKKLSDQYFGVDDLREYYIIQQFVYVYLMSCL